MSTNAQKSTENRPTADNNMGKVYDHFAQSFSESDKLPTWEYVGKPTLAKLLGDFFDKPNIKILDMGSASGRVEEHLLLKKGIQAKNITGVEISPDQVDIAKERIPDAIFLVGSIVDVSLPPENFDVAISHMVFEHLSDEDLLSACKIAFGTLKSGGTFAFVVTHPDKMTHVDGSLVEKDGPFTTSAPWGGELQNWRRSIEKTTSILEEAGFVVKLVDSVSFPIEAPENLSSNELFEFRKSSTKYNKYPAIRLAIKAIKP